MVTRHFHLTRHGAADAFGALTEPGTCHVVEPVAAPAASSPVGTWRHTPLIRGVFESEVSPGLAARSLPRRRRPRFGWTASLAAPR